MKKSFIFMLALCSGLAFADAPQVANSIDKATESIAPAFTNPYKDVGNIPVTFPNQPPLVPHKCTWLTSNKKCKPMFRLPLSGCCSNNGGTSRT